jgi:hypothetical protein
MPTPKADDVLVRVEAAPLSARSSALARWLVV